MGVRAAGFLAAFILWCGVEQAALAARFIDYLYVEANEGDSSGGHAAIRFENQTYHFQHENPGIIRVRRLDSSAFTHAYAKLGNRTIRESRIAVSDETYDLLEDAFIHLLLIQEAQLNIREALRRDVLLFELLLRQHHVQDHTAEEAQLSLKGFGYFLPDGPMHSGITAGASYSGSVALRSPALLSLRDRIRTTYGERFVEERKAQLKTLLQEMKLRAAEPPVSGLSPEIYPAFAPSAATRYNDAILALFALEVLQAAPPLRPGTFWTSDADIFKLEAEEALVLKTFAERQVSDLVRLVNSSRTDWGLPFVVGMARLAAIEASLASGQLVFLDVFPGDGRELRRDATTERLYLPAMKTQLSEVYLRRRGEFFMSGCLREADYSALERAGNLLLEVERASTTGSPLRKYPEAPFPSREAQRKDLVFPQMGEVALVQELEAARAVDGDFAKALSHLYSYDLVRRNCVTEIFAALNRTFGHLSLVREHASPSPGMDPVEMLREESVRRLGGFVDTSRGFVFIPFVSAGEVDACYAVVDRREIPSYRTERIAEMMEHETPLMVFFRESNTLSSTVYRPGPGDSSFLFFTEDTILLRPLFGAFNLVTGLGESLLGFVTMPAEGSDRFLSGVKGMLFSFPELVFVNLRKGSIVYVETKKMSL